MMKQILLALCCWAVTGGSAPLWADIIKLKDGATLEGAILEEDDKQVVIQVEFAGGSITRRDTVSKADIAEITRFTEEEKFQRAMQRDYDALKRYQLNPASSFPVTYYDQTISNVFFKFLAKYTNSPHQQEIEVRIAQWQTERDTVATGKVKYRGQWLDAAEGTKLMVSDRFRQQLDKAKALAAAGKFEEAVQQLRTISESGGEPAAVAEARRLEAETYRSWLQSYAQARTQLNADIKAANDQLATAKKAKSSAAKTAPKSGGKNTQKMGSSGAAYMAQVAGQQVKAAEDRVAQLKDQLKSLDKQVADLKSRAANASAAAKEIVAAKAGEDTSVSAPTETKVEVAAPPAAAPVEGASPAAEPAPTTWWEKSLQWVKEKWYFAAAGTLVLLWLVMRLFGK